MGRCRRNCVYQSHAPQAWAWVGSGHSAKGERGGPIGQGCFTAISSSRACHHGPHCSQFSVPECALCVRCAEGQRVRSQDPFSLLQCTRAAVACWACGDANTRPGSRPLGLADRLFGPCLYWGRGVHAGQGRGIGGGGGGGAQPVATRHITSPAHSTALARQHAHLLWWFAGTCAATPAAARPQSTAHIPRPCGPSAVGRHRRSPAAAAAWARGPAPARRPTGSF